MSEEPITNREKRRARDTSFAPDAHRALPASVDAEQGVLCSGLLDPSTIGLAIEKRVSPEMFHAPAHGTIWKVMVKLWEERKPVDSVLLMQELHDAGALDACGGPAFISQIYTFLPTAANVDHYLGILIEKHTLREMIRVSTEYAAKAYSEQHDVECLIDDFETKALSIRQFAVSKAPTVREVVLQVINQIEKTHDNTGIISGMSTGFPDFDGLIDGLKPAEMVVIAARPSHGKTALAMNMAEWISIGLGKPVGIFSLEMSTEQLVQRLIFTRARVDPRRWRDGLRTEGDFERIQQAASDIANAQIFIDDTAAMSIQEARAKARRWKSDHDIQAVFIDYLQLLRSTTRRGQENRQQEVSECSAGCKSMAKENGIPAIVLAQLDRGVDKQQRRPRLSDLRESGAIEQDADIVAALTREEMYAETAEARRECEGRAVLEILKQRNGALAPVHLTFFKEFTLFQPEVESEPTLDPQADLIDPGQIPSQPRRRRHSREVD